MYYGILIVTLSKKTTNIKNNLFTKISTKLKWLNDQLSQFELLLMPYLNRHGISRSHVQNYVKSGWLEVVVSGVYKKPSQNISWSSALAALQLQQVSTLHLAGLSSLAHQGVSHY